MVFTSDPGRYRQDLIKNGYAHLKSILSPDFVAWLEDFYRRAMANAVGEHLPRPYRWKEAAIRVRFSFGGGG
jgi:hypothetical protein